MCKCDIFNCSFPESVAYEFGAGRGLIQYQFPTGRHPDTEEDNISLGFITLKSDAVLLRIESSNTQDYFELEIVRNINFLIDFMRVNLTLHLVLLTNLLIYSFINLLIY